MLTLSQLVDYYLDYQKTYNRPATVINCRVVTNAIQEFWGAEREVASLTAQDMTTFIQHKRETVRPQAVSINNYLRVIRGMLNYGVNNGLLDSVPFKVRLLRTPAKKQLPILTPEEIQRLIRCANPPYKSIIAIAASTGMRLSEILNLTWRDVIPIERRLTVTGKNGWVPKSHQDRSIPAAEKLLTMFATIREQSRYDTLDDYVFATEDGTVRHPNPASHALRKVWIRAGIYKKGNPTLHHLRHTAASRMLNEGASLETVRVILGHSSITTTALYLHTTDEHKRNAIDSLSVW